MEYILENGIKAFKAQKYTEALNLLQPLANHGNAEAQCIIGNIYHLGLGVEKNGSEALKWYLKSAKQGDPIASNNLAGIYLMGDCGVIPNQEQAIEWYKLSQEKGFIKNPLFEKMLQNYLLDPNKL